VNSLAEIDRLINQLVQSGFALQGALCKTFYKKFGEDALPIISEVFSTAGVRMGENLSGRTLMKSLKEVGEAFVEMLQSVHTLPVDPVEISEEKIHFKALTCPYRLEGEGRALCEAVMAHMAEMLSVAVGREVQIDIPKTLAAGDKYCENIITLKTTTFNPEPRSSSATLTSVAPVPEATTT